MTISKQYLDKKLQICLYDMEKELDLFYSKTIHEILILTASVESDFGTYITQKNGPALGILQMEPATMMDIWENFCSFRPKYKRFIEKKFGMVCNDALKYDIDYQIVFCRLHYLRVPEALPLDLDPVLMAEYWKKWYNTELGKGKIEDAVKKYSLYGNNHVR